MTASPRRDATPLEQAIDRLHDEMRIAFEKVDARIENVSVRLETLTDRVTRHGEVLAAHRARDVDASSVEPKMWTKRQLTTATAFAATAVVILVELLRWIGTRLR